MDLVTLEIVLQTRGKIGKDAIFDGGVDSWTFGKAGISNECFC